MHQVGLDIPLREREREREAPDFSDFIREDLWTFYLKMTEIITHSVPN